MHPTLRFEGTHTHKKKRTEKINTQQTKVDHKSTQCNPEILQYTTQTVVLTLQTNAGFSNHQFVAVHRTLCIMVTLIGRLAKPDITLWYKHRTFVNYVDAIAGFPAFLSNVFMYHWCRHGTPWKKCNSFTKAALFYVCRVPNK